MTKLSRIIRDPLSFYRAQKTVKYFKRGQKRFKENEINHQAPVQSYFDFFRSFKPQKIGDYTLSIGNASFESPGILTLTKKTPRQLGTMHFRVGSKRIDLPQPFQQIKVRNQNRLFKIRFLLTDVLEPQLKHALNQQNPSGVCVVLDWQGPSPNRYEKSHDLVKEANQELGEPWQHFMLSQLMNHAQQQGSKAIALLRPEFNQSIQEQHLTRRGVTAEQGESIRSQFYAVARKMGFKKVKDSRYLWRWF